MLISDSSLPEFPGLLTRRIEFRDGIVVKSRCALRVGFFVSALSGHLMAAKYFLYSANITLGWSIVKCIGFERAEALVYARRMRRVYDGLGNHVGYQPTGTKESSDKDLPSLRSSASITAREIEANAGCMGESATEHLDEHRRTHRLHTRTGHVLPAEDFVERARAKVAMFGASRLR